MKSLSVMLALFAFSVVPVTSEAAQPGCQDAWDIHINEGDFRDLGRGFVYYKTEFGSEYGFRTLVVLESCSTRKQLLLTSQWRRFEESTPFEEAFDEDFDYLDVVDRTAFEVFSSEEVYEFAELADEFAIPDALKEYRTGRKQSCACHVIYPAMKLGVTQLFQKDVTQ
ncbi:hypothetical protein CSC82_17915 [Rhodobacteraceae bacterium 4F10]|nr:hypothetical protein CSC82_17915 [Rhodobacteraceae bacterium 4F10]